MSEDEAIKRLQEILDFKKNTIDKIEDPIEREIEENCYIEEMPFEAIETILHLYQQKKERIEELEKRLEEKEKEVVLVPEGTCFVKVPKDVISKDRIKDMQIYREFELQQEYKDFENDTEWKIYNKILEEE